MKAFLKVVVVTLFASMTGLAGYASQPPSHQNSLAQAQNVLGQNSPISVFLPDLAKVLLKGGSSMSGRLTALDAQAQQIKLELSGESEILEIADIEKVEFRGEVILGCGNSDCKIVIRGDEEETSAGNNQKTWREPLTNFRVINPSTGKAQIQLASLPKLELRGILAVAASSSYVVDEIQFDSSGMITLKVTPR
ncbi:MAG: hypothetical protein QNJ55_03260 [Xenococcus sp. MO_188.B8]|nr:hypothetical protein [Xenococcus sp. MO_188.B8]